MELQAFIQKSYYSHISNIESLKPMNFFQQLNSTKKQLRIFVFSSNVLDYIEST